MLSKLLFILVPFIYLLILNYLQKKNRFCLDRVEKNEQHKILAISDNYVPLSGAFFFIPLIVFLNIENENITLFFCLIFFGIGFLSDLKILSSPKIRLYLQVFTILIFSYLNKDLVLDLRIEFFNSLMLHEVTRIALISFFLLVLINGYNFIDGVNCSSSLNFLLVLFFYYLLINQTQNDLLNEKVVFLLSFCLVFVILNFFGKNFLGDSGVYGLSFLVGIMLIELSVFNKNISPYFIANLLWYPAFENLFSNIRRIIKKEKNYLADNYHLHQLIFKYLLNKNLLIKKFILSSITGISINFYLLISYIIGYYYYEKTNIQICLILSGVISYISIYILLLNKTKN